MDNAVSILLNEKFLAVDNRLNYESYKNLLLKCEICEQAVFFKKASDFNKPGIKRIAHFSHYKDIGNIPCSERTESNTTTQETGSEGKKQSLENYQMKIQQIIYEGIVYYQKISNLQLHQRINEGEILVNLYEIDLYSWLCQFSNKREDIKKLALSLYHNKSSEIECRVFSNIVNYLCFPVSADILKKVLYYVFLFNKEIFINNACDEVFSKTIKLISYINLGSEYQQAQKSLTAFNDDNLTEEVLSQDTDLETETVEPKMVTIPSFLGSYKTEVLETTELEYYLCRIKESKNGKVFYQRIARKTYETISISWYEDKDKEYEYLTLRHNTSIVATFYLTKDRTIKWNPLSVFFVNQTIIALLATRSPKEYILSENLYGFFIQWVNSSVFEFWVNRNASLSIYPVHFVKLLFLFKAYINERSGLTKSIGDGLTVEVEVRPVLVDSIYNESLLKLAGKSKSMKKRYLMSNSPIKKLKISHL
ncbi:hypothetical protein [Microcoleus sp. B4-D4]|uniref:hypothetical protein n=1 Tax=Microcoleus sp. B4-D4 TaxID=2818667 RepID=UPI002FD5A3B8